MAIAQGLVDKNCASADALVAKRLLLAEDAKRLIEQAEKDGIRKGP